MKRTWTILPLMLAVLAVASTGCYTVLRHPTNAVTQETYESHEEYRSCADCHSGASYYHPYFSYGSTHSRWSRYYGDPWWYGDYWYWTPDGSDEGEPRAVERDTRHLWSGGGWATEGWGFRAPSSTATSDRDSDEGSTTAKPKEDEKKEKKETDEKHLWQPKKKGF